LASILFLDDEEARYSHFRSLLRNIPNIKIVWVKTAREAIRAIDQKKYDIISLDHDLGGKGSGFTPDYPGDVPELHHLFGAQVPVTKQEPSGLTVANAIAKTTNSTSLIFIHSMNQVGAQRMKQVLPNAHVIPYHHVWLEVQIIQHALQISNIKQENYSGLQGY